MPGLGLLGFSNHEAAPPSLSANTKPGNLWFYDCICVVSGDAIISYDADEKEDNEGISCFICTAELAVLFNDPTRLWLNPTTVFQKSPWHKATNFKAAGNRNLFRRKAGR